MVKGWKESTYKVDVTITHNDALYWNEKWYIGIFVKQIDRYLMSRQIVRHVTSYYNQ